jgi:hypothetical protein
MRRSFALVVLLLSAFTHGQLLKADKNPHTFSVQVKHGWARQADGSIKDISGMVFPAEIQRIDAKPISARKLIAKKRLADMLTPPVVRIMARFTRPLVPVPTPALLDSTVYQADSGSYAYIDPAEFPDPSSLDDLGTVGGGNQSWSTLQFGFHVEGDALGNIPALVFINWKGFSSYNSAAPATDNAFSGMFTNFAVTFLASDVPGGQPGSYKLTINVAAAGAVSPSNTMYVAQQFWKDNEQNFEDQYRNLYSVGAGPTIGSSLNQFWFDWDPLDGIFTNGEIDILSGDGTFSNHLRTLTTSGGGGTQDTLVPFSVTFPVGLNPQGSFTDAWNSDDTYVSIQRGIIPNPSIAPMQIEMEGLAQATTATNLKFKLEAGTSTAGSTQKTYLFNYVTNAYDLVDTRSSTSTDSAFTVNITSNPAKYINQSNKHVKTLVTFTAVIALNNLWRARIDQGNWIVTR